jgi:ribose transport system substrate-binding protein
MRSLLFLVATASLLVVPSCNRNTKQVIGVVPKGASHIFWQTVHAGAVKAARENGYEVEWNAPTLEIDASRQIQIVEAMVARNLAALVLAPVDRSALVTSVNKAMERGMPVAIFDSALESKNRTFYIATDNRESGRLAARRLAEVIGDKGEVGIIGFMPGSASTMEREAGFELEMKEHHPNIRVVGTQFCMADRAKAVAATENMMNAHPDLAGIFADNESSSVGAVQALKQRNNGKTKLVAYDASETLIADLKGGSIDSIVVQNPFKMGYESTKAVIAKLKGQPIPADMDSGAVLVRREDLEKPQIKALLYPDIQQYLH